MNSTDDKMNTTKQCPSHFSNKSSSNVRKDVLMFLKNVFAKSVDSKMLHWRRCVLFLKLYSKMYNMEFLCYTSSANIKYCNSNILDMTQLKIGYIERIKIRIEDQQ